MTDPTTKQGVLLINIGTPDAPRPKAVRRYLREFLGDPRVLTMSAAARWLLLNAVILPTRPRRSAAAYAKIWQPEGSPLLLHGRALAQSVGEALGPAFHVELAMRYGNPGVDAALDKFEQANVRDVVVLPLFPQYSEAATGSAIAHVEARAGRRSSPPRLRFIRDFYADPGFVRAFAMNARTGLEAFRPDHVLMSYHGLPESQLEAQQIGCFSVPGCCDDPARAASGCYRAQCYATSRSLAAELALDPAGYSTSFQSRLGRQPWIKPYTDLIVSDLAESGIKRFAVLCPAFAADCLETLEEIGIRLDAQWRSLGGDALHLCPCPNGSDAFAHAIVAMVTRAGPG